MDSCQSCRSWQLIPCASPSVMITPSCTKYVIQPSTGPYLQLWKASLILSCQQDALTLLWHVTLILCQPKCADNSPLAPWLVLVSCSLSQFGSKVRDAQLHFRCEHKVTAPPSFPVKTENRHQAENRILSCLKASVSCIVRQKVQKLRFPFTQWHQASLQREGEMVTNETRSVNTYHICGKHFLTANDAYEAISK